MKLHAGSEGRSRVRLLSQRSDDRWRHRVLPTLGRQRRFVAVLALLTLVDPQLATEHARALAPRFVGMRAVTTGTDFSAVPEFFFAANDGIHGSELWKSDGTDAGTVLVKDIFPSADSSYPADFKVVDGTVLFVADNPIYGRELWTTDGTEAGTALVKDINPGRRGSYPFLLDDLSGDLFLSAEDELHGRELWRTDGTDVGTFLVRDIARGEDDALSYYGDYFFGVYFDDMARAGSVLLFPAYNHAHGWEVWRSDGSEAGTSLVRDVRLGRDSSYPYGFTESGGSVFLAADDGAHGVELWTSDGTELGTVMVKNLRPGKNDSFPFGMTEFAGNLFFTANAPDAPVLWRSDGTATGTIRLGNRLNPFTLTVAGPRLFFLRTPWDPEGSRHELWASDGTHSGTTMIKRNLITSNFLAAVRLIDVSETLFIGINHRPDRVELWRSDGTTDGTVLLRTVYEGRSRDGVRPVGVVDSTLFFKVRGGELWRSDGTIDGTLPVKDILP